MAGWMEKSVRYAIKFKLTIECEWFFALAFSLTRSRCRIVIKFQTKSTFHSDGKFFALQIFFKLKFFPALARFFYEAAEWRDEKFATELSSRRCGGGDERGSVRRKIAQLNQT
jgi:hypothetical protein